MGPLVSADGSVVGALVVSKDIYKQGWKFELSETLVFVLAVLYPDIFQNYIQILYSLDIFGSTKGCRFPQVLVPSIRCQKHKQQNTTQYRIGQNWSNMSQKSKIDQ